jgi:fucose permease
VQRLYEEPIVATFHGVWSLACLLAAAVGTYMISQGISPTVHFCIVSIAVVVVIITNRRDSTIKKNEASEKKPFFIKPDKYLFVLGLICFCAMICEATVFDWSVNYFRKVVKTDRSIVTVGYTAFITTMTIGRFLGDKAIKHLGLEKVLLVCGLLMSAGFVIAVSFPYLWSAGFGFLLIGLGDSIVVPSVFSLAGQSVKMKPAYAIASVSLIGYAGFLAGPLIVGSLSQSFGMPSAFSLMAALSFCISVLSVILKRTEREVPLAA